MNMITCCDPTTRNKEIIHFLFSLHINCNSFSNFFFRDHSIPTNQNTLKDTLATFLNNSTLNRKIMTWYQM